MSFLLIGTTLLGLMLLVLAAFLRENKTVALLVAGFGLLMAFGGVGVFVLVVTQMR